MKKTHGVVMLTILLIAQQSMSENNSVVKSNNVDASRISLKPVQETGSSILFHEVTLAGASSIMAHGVSPLGTSPSKKTSQHGQTTRVKRAVSAFDLSDL